MSDTQNPQTSAPFSLDAVACFITNVLEDDVQKGVLHVAMDEGAVTTHDHFRFQCGKDGEVLLTAIAKDGDGDTEPTKWDEMSPPQVLMDSDAIVWQKGFEAITVRVGDVLQEFIAPVPLLEQDEMQAFLSEHLPVNATEAEVVSSWIDMYGENMGDTTHTLERRAGVWCSVGYEIVGDYHVLDPAEAMGTNASVGGFDEEFYVGTLTIGDAAHTFGEGPE